MRAVRIETTVNDSAYKGCGRYVTKTAHRHLSAPRISVAEVPDPKVGPYDVLISPLACGLCGSDVAMITADETGFVRYPFMMANKIIPGHEFSGIAEDFGSKVKTYWPELRRGELVTAQCVLPCGLCAACKEGTTDSCLFGNELGFTRNGALAEWCTVNMRQVWSIESLRPNYGTLRAAALAGSMIEPHAGVYKAIRASGFHPGHDVLVIGLGPIGLAAINTFRALGAAGIFGYDPSPTRQDIARALGASVASGPQKFSLYDFVSTYTQHKGVATMFEASGVAEKNWTDIERLLIAGPSHAKFIFFGQSRETLSVNPQPFIQKFITFMGSHGHTNVWQEVINLFARGRIDPMKIITSISILDDVPQWLGTLQTDKTEGKITCLVSDDAHEGEHHATRV